MGVTTDPSDPDLTRGVDEEPVPQAATYLVLSSEEIAKGYARPLRFAYQHTTCGTVTTMGGALAETYARQPDFYGATYCCACQMHRPVGAEGEFVWVEDGRPTDIKVGT